MELNVYKIDGTKTEDKVTLSPDVFEVEVNEHAVYLAVKSYLANQRQGTHAVKSRNKVSGGGAKPFRQKGTGRARQGTTRSPHMVGGGVAHGPLPRDYTQTLPKKLMKVARKSALSAKAKDAKIFVVEDFSFDEPKTKKFAEMIKSLNIDTNKVLFVSTDLDKNLVLSARNIPYTKVYKAPEFSVYDVVNSGCVVLQKGAVEIVNEVLA